MIADVRPMLITVAPNLMTIEAEKVHTEKNYSQENNFQAINEKLDKQDV